MERIDYIRRHLKKYPLMEYADIYKLVYQSIYLVGHLLESSGNGINKVEKYLQEEMLTLNENENRFDLLYEYIDNEVVRINIYPFVRKYSIAKLCQMFITTGMYKVDNSIDIKKIMCNCIKELQDLNYNYSNNEISLYLGNIPSHSNTYRKNYYPHYRVCLSSLLDIDMKVSLFQSFLGSLQQDELQIIAVEGRCGSGKTTITSMLRNVTIIHIDDHFDGELFNIEYVELLLSNLTIGQIIEEKCYNCKDNTFHIERKEIKNVVIVEGSYSYIERLRKYYKKLVYIVCGKSTQKKRIEKRINYNEFINKWIPREEEYLKKEHLISIADILI